MSGRPISTQPIDTGNLQSAPGKGCGSASRRQRGTLPGVVEQGEADGPHLYGRLTLDEARRRVVEPVVEGVLRAGELDQVRLWWKPDPPRWPLPESADPWQNGELPPYEQWVRVTARGESFVTNFWKSHDNDASLTVVEAASKLASLLEDWVCETRFGWGQQRTASYQLPD